MQEKAELLIFLLCMCVPWENGDFHENAFKRKVARSEAVKPLHSFENDKLSLKESFVQSCL